jgi:hypothetical protein
MARVRRGNLAFAAVNSHEAKRRCTAACLPLTLGFLPGLSDGAIQRMSPLSLPSGYTRIKRVSSFLELLSTPLTDGVNALCWERRLPDGFDEVVRLLGDLDEGITPLDEARLTSLPASTAGRAAIDFMLADLRQLREHGLSPELNCIQAYPRDEEPAAVPVDVYSFHADSAPVETDTWLCTYHGPASEGLRNDEALRRVDIPETRAELLRLFGGADNAAFREFLAENCYDLHYAAAPHAQPFSFCLGNLWRISTDWPGSPVPPCIHRAPDTTPGQPPRLLLIS